MKKVLLVLLCLAFAAPTYAVTGVAFGLRGGLATNYDQPGFEADKDYMTQAGLIVKWTSVPYVDVIFTGDYAWKKESFSYIGLPLEMKWHDFQFSASAVYPFEVPVVSPYAGAGLGTHSLGYDYSTGGSWVLSDYGIESSGSETRLGYHLVGGFDVGIPTFPLTFNAEIRMHWIDTPGDAIQYNSFVAGLTFGL
jgi:hypothetical protein